MECSHHKAIQIMMEIFLLAAAWLLPFLQKQEEKLIPAFSDQKKVIVIDPGHGGNDPGKVSPSGVLEKDINLEISKKLSEILRQSGYDVILTRDSDRGLYEEGSESKKLQDLQGRCELIRQADPLLTVSIHQNSFADTQVCGPQVFYYPSSAEGKRLAECIQSSMNRCQHVMRQRTAKAESSYYLLKRSVGITVIAECAFLSCPEEEKLIQKEAYQYELASAVGTGIHQFLCQKEAG